MPTRSNDRSRDFSLGLSRPSRRRHGTLVRDLHRQMRDGIVSGRLAAGLLLPSTRALGKDLGVSRNTVAAVYDLLFSEGLINTRQGAGTFVATANRNCGEGPASRHDGSPSEQPLPVAHLLTGALPVHPGAIDMRIGLPDQGAVPWAAWRRLTLQAMRLYERAPSIDIDLQGLTELREAIAMHLSFYRAVACPPEQIIVTCGGHSGLEIVARTLIEPGKTLVAVEDPGLPAAWVPFRLAGARITSVPVDEGGLIVDAVPEDAKIIFVTPSTQFPTGVALTLTRRRRLLEHATRTGAMIIEYDYESEFWHGGQPLDALKTMDRSDRVLYFGTFSKCLFPGIRMGFLTVPAHLRRDFVETLRSSKFSVPTVQQLALAKLISQGHLARHIRRMRRIYGSRRTALTRAIDRHLCDSLEIMPGSAGLHVSARVDPGLSLDRLAEAGLSAGVTFHRLDAMSLEEPPLHAIGLGFGQSPEDLYDDAMSRVAARL